MSELVCAAVGEFRCERSTNTNTHQHLPQISTKKSSQTRETDLRENKGKSLILM
jgi:hypothetical protein